MPRRQSLANDSTPQIPPDPKTPGYSLSTRPPKTSGPDTLNRALLNTSLVPTGPDSKVSDVDGQPYTTILYGNGPGFATPRIVPMNTSAAPDDRNQVHGAAVPRQWATHGGEDVPVYALGPLATSLFTGTFDQSYIPHAIAYGACLGEHRLRCQQGGGRDNYTARQQCADAATTTTVVGGNGGAVVGASGVVGSGGAHVVVASSVMADDGSRVKGRAAAAWRGDAGRKWEMVAVVVGVMGAVT